MIYIPTDMYDKLMAYAHAAEPYSGEVGGFLFIDLDEDNDLFIEDVVLVKQEATQGSTDLTDGLAELIPTLTKEQMKKLLGGWHSHGKMDVFWSHQDEEMIKSLIEFYPWFVSIEVNIYGKMIARLDIAKPFPLRFTQQVQICTTQDSVDAMKKEVEEKVTKPVYTFRKCQGGIHNNSYSEGGNGLVSYITEDGIRVYTTRSIRDRALLEPGVKELQSTTTMGSETFDGSWIDEPEELSDDEFTELGFLPPWSDA